jgi:aminopeptidase N
MYPRIRVLGLLMTLAASAADAQVVLSPTHYDLNFELDYASEVLRGTVRIVVENPSNSPLDTASLLLYRLLRVRAARDDQARDLAFTQAVATFEDFGKLQVNQVLVTLAEPLAPGAQTAIQLQYDGYLLGYAETGMHYVQDRIDPEFTILRDDSYVYPQPGYPSVAVNRSVPPSSFTYSARITVPKDLVVANGGRPEAVDTVGDTVAFRFSSLRPSWRMDFAIARYTLLSSGTIRVYHLPDDGPGAAAVAKAAAQALGVYSDWFGPLHDPAAFTIIEVPDGWGSQADVTAVIQTAAAFRDPERHHEVYHELSHLWDVPPTDLPFPRWNEGLASFLEYLVTEELTGERVVDARATLLLDWLRETLPARPQWREVPFIDYGRANLTDLSYFVGAMFFDLLYRLVGRETFNAIIGEYVADFGSSGGSTRDLAGVITRAATMDLSRLVDDWLYTTAWADRIAQSANIQDLAALYRPGDPKERK